MSSNIFCHNYGMDLLRVETDGERETLMRSAKLSWVELDEEYFIDGKSQANGKFKFIGNDKDLPDEIHNHSDFNNEKPYREYKNIVNEDCLVLGKYLWNPQLRLAGCRKKHKFACQKVSYQQTPNNTNDRGPLKVDVASRFFEEMGSGTEIHENDYYKRSSYFINRSDREGVMGQFSISSSNALNLCTNFGMNLVEISDQGELQLLMRLIIKGRENIGKQILIGSIRSGTVDNFLLDFDPFSAVIFDLSKSCLFLSSHHATGSFKTEFSECHRVSRYLCEKVEYRRSTLDYNVLNPRPKLTEKTSGMKLLGEFNRCKKPLEASFLF